MNLRRPKRRLAIENLEVRRLMVADMDVIEQASATMSIYDQQMLELINRARADPLAEAARRQIDLNEGLNPGAITSDPKQPLAPITVLNDVAIAHSQDMIERGFFAHENPDGLRPFERALNAGYGSGFAGENLAARSGISLVRASTLLHFDLYGSPGHRYNFLLPRYRDVGLGFERGPITFSSGQIATGILVTQVFGGGVQDEYSITGVAFEDSKTADDFYSLGEGRGGIIIEARQSNGPLFVTTTGSSGGYALRVGSGSYQLTAYSSSRLESIDLGVIVVTDQNIKIDVRTEEFVSVDPVKESLVLLGADELIRLADPQVDLSALVTIDIRGKGDNTLVVDAGRLGSLLPLTPLTVLANSGDRVVFEPGWKFESARLSEGALIRQFRHDQAIIDLVGPSSFQNPVNAFDVSGDLSVTASDALKIINELSLRRYSNNPNGELRDEQSIDVNLFNFYDVSGDFKVTALDALQVINAIIHDSNPVVVVPEPEQYGTVEKSDRDEPSENLRRINGISETLTAPSVLIRSTAWMSDSTSVSSGSPPPSGVESVRDNERVRDHLFSSLADIGFSIDSMALRSLE
ncbi:Dockerin type I repeat protein [Novipirellula aureliae]|uniref:Dockerin type I repeat protein n=1 Tax=Novipirellula aureliae TaxID=2527966 RepID=A0A5C6DGJ8_9BACT|nr:dockerin type I domain-containing protein [Novipirellula aureliae]TWU35782.1 Dockerin type I repeat protein [Novipirellula aureliae]